MVMIVPILESYFLYEVLLTFLAQNRSSIFETPSPCGRGEHRISFFRDVNLIPFVPGGFSEERDQPKERCKFRKANGRRKGKPLQNIFSSLHTAYTWTRRHDILEWGEKELKMSLPPPPLPDCWWSLAQQWPLRDNVGISSALAIVFCPFMALFWPAIRYFIGKRQCPN